MTDFKRQEGSNHEPGSLADDQGAGLHFHSEESAVRRLVEGEERIVEGDEIPYKFVWELVYRDGGRRRQYFFLGSQLVQTMFGKLPDKDQVREILVYDAEDPNPQKVPVVRIGIPHGALAEICYNCKLDFGSVASKQTKRIYTFGWYVGSNKEWPDRARYVHIDPITRQYLENPWRCIKPQRRSDEEDPLAGIEVPVIGEGS